MITATSPPPQNLLTAAASGESPSPISLLPDDLLLEILSLLSFTADPRLLPRLSGVSRRFRRLLHSPLPSSLPLPLPPSPSFPYPTLHKLTICCPGLLHAGVVVAHFSLDCDFSDPRPNHSSLPYPLPPANSAAATVTSTSTWSLFDNLSETLDNVAHDTNSANLTSSETIPADTNIGNCSSSNQHQNITYSFSYKTRLKPLWREKSMGPPGSHLASSNWSLSRKNGSKLLAWEFCDDSLYICKWPGCVHQEEKRKYMLFRGVFEDFKRSRVWKKIMDDKWLKIRLDCAYCTCNEMWDLHLAGCLADSRKFHEDGEPFVQAFVCDNGHVSGAWHGRLRGKYQMLDAKRVRVRNYYRLLY